MDFEFIGGDDALNFVGTVAERTTTRRERLTGPRDLAEWLAQSGVLDTAPPTSEADLVTARELREALYRYLRALTAHARCPPETIATINKYALHPPPTLQLGPDGRPTSTGTVAAALASLARSAILLADPATNARIRWCDDETCTRPFLDRSRANRRRWCGMSGCGDRAKAAAYRRRSADRRGR